MRVSIGSPETAATSFDKGRFTLCPRDEFYCAKVPVFAM
jgi:hypothetical protein